MSSGTSSQIYIKFNYDLINNQLKNELWSFRPDQSFRPEGGREGGGRGLGREGERERGREGAVREGGEGGTTTTSTTTTTTITTTVAYEYSVWFSQCS